MKAGRNTPQSVLLYIDTVWERNEPANPLELARELGYDPKAIAGLQAKHGANLIVYLEKVQRARQEVPRFLAIQQGRAHPEQYVASAQGAIDDGEAVDELSQKRFTAEARARDRLVAQELVLAVEDVRAALSKRMKHSPELQKMAGRSLYRITAELDRVAKNAKRRAA